MSSYYHRYTFRPEPLQADVLRQLADIPGVRINTRGRRAGTVDAPLHAAWIVEALFRRYAIPARVYAPDVPSDPSWEQVRARLQDTEVRPWVLDGWLRSFQETGIAFAVEKLGAALIWPAGAGKTAAAVLWGLYQPGSIVVVTKASVRGQFAREIQELSDTRPYVVRPPSSFTSARRRAAYPSLAEYAARCRERGDRPIVVIGWPALPRHVAELGALHPTSVVFDEIHLGKGYRRRTRILQPDGTYRYVDLANVVASAAKLARWAQRRLGTTATPVKDRVRDVWGQTDLLLPGSMGANLAFCKRYCDALPGAFGGWDTTGSSNVDELRARLSFFTHRLAYAETHGDLPPKRRQSLYLSPEDQDRPRNFKRELRKAAARGAGALLEVRLAEAASRKRSAVVEAAMDQLRSGGKVVIFTGRHREAASLEKALLSATAREKLDCPVWMGHGGNTNPESRETLRRQYMAAAGPAVLVGTGAAWGTGYNLHDTDLAIIAMLPWTGGELHQWEGRFSRQGQKRPVLILYPVCEGTVDEHVVARLISKLPAMEAIAGDSETAGALDAIIGTEDKEAVAQSIVAKLMAEEEWDVDD